MLGHVARHLRLLGFDAAYAGRAPDPEVLGRCQREGRMLVTRDRGLARRAGGIPHLLVERSDRLAQTVEVLHALGAGPRPVPLSRCLACNEALEELSPARAWGRVPDHVALTSRRFSACPRCHRVFWEGTHFPRLEARIRHLTEALQGLDRPV
jgi:uncharacterized protein with PIN domain